MLEADGKVKFVKTGWGRSDIPELCEARKNRRLACFSLSSAIAIVLSPNQTVDNVCSGCLYAKKTGIAAVPHCTPVLIRGVDDRDQQLRLLMPSLSGHE